MRAGNGQSGTNTRANGTTFSTLSKASMATDVLTTTTQTHPREQVEQRNRMPRPASDARRETHRDRDFTCFGLFVDWFRAHHED